MNAAYEVLTRDGIGGFSVERVAAEAAVGRSTIYRWWPSRGALAVECLLEAVRQPHRPAESGDASQDLKAHVRQVIGIMRGEAGRIIASIMAEGQSDPDTLAAFEAGYLGPCRLDLEKILLSGIRSGQLRRDLDVGMTIDLLIGGLFYRLLTLGSLTDADLADRLVGNVLRGGLPAPQPHRAASAH